MKQKPENKSVNILREIEANKIAPVYLLSGTETFLIEGTLKQILDKLLPPESRDFNLSILDGSIVSVREILSHVDLYPMMSDWRVVVVENFPAFKSQNRTSSPLTIIRNAMQHESENIQRCVTDIAKLLGTTSQQIADNHPAYNSAIEEITQKQGGVLSNDIHSFFLRLPNLASQIENHSDNDNEDNNTDLMMEWLQGELPKSSVLIFVVKGEVSDKNRFVNAIQAVGRYVSYDVDEKGNSLNKDPLYKKVVEKLASFDKKITPRAFDQLRKRTGGDMQLVSEAINKIIDFVGEKQQIDEIDIRNVVSQSNYDVIFDITDAISRRSTKHAVKSLREVISSGLDPIPITAAIANHIRFFVQAKLIITKKGIKPISRQMRYPDFTSKIFQPLTEELGELLPSSQTYNILKRSPYITYKIFQSINSFTLPELMEALNKVLDVEIQLKTTPFNREVLLEQLVIDICSTSKKKR
ncbi:hypothetical protein JT359_15180 [Candidatus Poribacteria bacterium]|nr:hypothetical protein [Candidatus Poribacteria bacterium]